MTSPIRADLKLRNNRLIKMREALGYRSAKAFADAMGLHYSRYVSIENMSPDPDGRRSAVVGVDGWLPFAIKIAKIHGVEPDYLWPEAVRLLQKTRASTVVTEEQAHRLIEASGQDPVMIPDEIMEGRDRHNTLHEAAGRVLDPREKLMLHLRYGEERTFTEIGDELGLSQERTRQIIARAEKKLRDDPSLREACI